MRAGRWKSEGEIIGDLPMPLSLLMLQALTFTTTRPRT